ncbi:MAG: adenylosuccinate synthetase [archaeon]
MMGCSKRLQMLRRLKAKSLTGMQWGDEGKGRLVDLLAGEVDVIVRWHGGANAGHTIVVGDTKVVTHLVPSGVMQGKMGLVAQYCVVDPILAMKELDDFVDMGITPQVFFDNHTNMVMPWDFASDAAKEIRRGAKAIGTTGRGIGPCYGSRVDRSSRFVFSEMLNVDKFAEKFDEIRDMKIRELESIRRAMPKKYKSKITELINKMWAVQPDQYLDEVGPNIGDYLVNVVNVISDLTQQGKSIGFEGAHGMLLDVDYGTRPFVTSSNIIPLMIPAAIGRAISTYNVGVLKAYQTRVGEGPMPTELFDETGVYLQQKGGEVGATTGRNRRCGWLDMVLASYTASFGIHSLGITKVDVLSGLDEIKLCIGYRASDGAEWRLDENSGMSVRGWDKFDITKLEEYEPIYETHPGFEMDGKDYCCCRDLPENLRSYIHRVSDLLNLSVDTITFGPERSQYLDVQKCNVGRNPCSHDEKHQDSSGGCKDCGNCS